VPDRLAMVAVVAGTVFSAISGSTIATTAMLGSLMLPVMLSRGYHPTIAAGPIMAIGAVDMLIPPSALTVLLGSLSCMTLFIILGATTFAQILSFSGASSGLVQYITGQGLSTSLIVVGMMLMLIFLGIFVDQVSMMMITLPIFMPVVQAPGIDPIWFGVMFLICMQLGLLLPPHGLLLMTMRGVAPPSVTMGHIFIAVVPYVVMSLVLLAAVFWIPQIATWLPQLIG
jgi:TRAP-type C4-dicarboxylate transport system permease large subunit